jgi:hypothetical protein
MYIHHPLILARALRPSYGRGGQTPEGIYMHNVDNNIRIIDSREQ